MEIFISQDREAIKRRLGGVFYLSQSRAMMEEEAKLAVDAVKNTISAVGIRTRTGNLMDAIGYTVDSSTEATVYLDEEQAPYAKYLEHGYSPFDMKPGLLGGKNAKMSAEGNSYNRIPLGGGKFRTISEKPRYTKTGALAKRQAKWFHPGYSGRLFWQQGMSLAEYSILIYTTETLSRLL